MPYTAPAVSLIQPDLINNLGIQTSVAANALTVTMTDRAFGSLTAANIATVAFRSATITNGTFNLRNISNGINITVPSGATLGHQNSKTQYVYVYLLDNSGTVEVAVSSTSYDDGIYASTTAISAGSTNSRIIYSNTARTNVPIRLVGRISSNQTTAGTWSAGPLAVSLQPFITAPQTWSTATARAEWARITFSSGTPVIFASSSAWLTSITDNGTGDITLNFEAFGANPYIFLTPENTANDKLSLTIASFSTTTANIHISRSDTATLVDTNFFVMAIGDS